MTTIDVKHIRLSFAGIVHSEWIKLRSLRSTFWCYLIVVVLMIGLAALVASALPTGGAASGVAGPRGAAALPTKPDATWLLVSTVGVTFAQLVVAVLGALVITGEYGTGMIRSTFAAVPTRLQALAAKALVFGVVTFVVTFASLVVGALLAAPILDGRGTHPDLSDSSIWLALVGAAGYLTLLGILAMAIGVLIRSTAGAIATALGLVLVAPIIFNLVATLTQADWPRNVGAFLPSGAGGRMYAFEPTGGVTDGVLTLDGWQGLLVLAGWCVVTAVAGAILVKRRDA